MTVPDAVLAMVRAAVPEVDVFDAMVPDTPPTRYAVVYIDPGTRAALAVCGQSDSATVRWTLHAIGPDRQTAQWITARILDNTVDTRPVAPGWVCGPVEHTFSEQPNRNEPVAERPVVLQIDLFKLLASRA